MAEVPAVGAPNPLAYPAPASRDPRAAGEPAVSRTVRIVNGVQTELNHLEQSAAARGEVVTQTGIKLHYEAQGLTLAARSGEAAFNSKHPEPTVSDVAAQVQQQQHAAPAAPQAAPPSDHVSRAKTSHAAEVAKLEAATNATAAPAAIQRAASAPAPAKPALDAKA